MRRIASTTELQAELSRIMSYTRSERPSRVRIARELFSLSDRVAKAQKFPFKTQAEKYLQSEGYTEKHGEWLNSKGESAEIKEEGNRFIVDLD